MSFQEAITKWKWIDLPRTERAEVLQNPYCGFYSIYRFFAHGKGEDIDGIPIDEVTVEKGQQLCLVEINLLYFNEGPLNKQALHIIRLIFQHFTRLKKQMIVRFLYDWEGRGILSEPKEMEIILEHMSQLSPLLKDFTDQIYILQGLFIGSWGEMHNSRYLGERHMSRLAKQMYDCSGPRTQIALRCPNFWRLLFKTYHPLERRVAFTDIQKARFSLFNDGIMASETDFGTYGDRGSRDAVAYGDKWDRRDELEFQNQLCKYVSNGGEVIQECVWNDAGPALDSLKQMRISYLHSKYDEKVLNKWRLSNSGISSTPWKNKTAFEYIEAHLGYRFTLQNIQIFPVQDKSGRVRVVVNITNQGFAPCYNEFEVKVVLRDTAFSKVFEYRIETDTRMWMPDERVVLETILPKAEPGEYVLCMGIYDSRSKKFIEIANTFSAMDHMGNYSLGHLICEA